MTRWVPFLGLTALVLTLLLGLARLSQGVVRDGPPELPADDVGEDAVTTGPTGDDADGQPTETDPASSETTAEDCPAAGVDETVADAGSAGSTASGPGRADAGTGTEPVGIPGTTGRTGPTVGSDPSAQSDPGNHRTRSPDPDHGSRKLTTGALLANVALTQGVFGGVVLAAAVFYGIPGEALGVTAGPWTGGLPAVALGAVFGTALWVANEATASLADAVGASYDEGLREMLAPDSLAGWVVLLGVVLPVIAGVEEFLFRAAIIGAPAAGFGISPWALAVVSSAAFALGHGAQGRVGIAVTGGLGFVLAAGFVLSGSLLVVVVAHYLVNALEFVVHEGLGVDRIAS